MVLFGGFMEGKWTPDVAVLLSEIVFKQIVAIGVKAEVPNMKMFLKDQSNNKFRSKFAKFKLGAKEMKPDDDKVNNFVEEMKEELKEEPEGLMAKESE